MAARCFWSGYSLRMAESPMKRETKDWRDSRECGVGRGMLEYLKEPKGDG